MPVISAIVVNYNGRQHLETCLPALLGQDPAPSEVLLIDNRSEDDSIAFVQERFPSVRVIDAGANLGPAGARNLGAARARHDRILFVDNDVALEPGALRALDDALAADRQLGMVQARSVCADEPGVVHYDAADLHCLGTLVLHNWFTPLPEAKPPGEQVGAVIALCLLVRRRAFFAAGQFDPELFILYEDNDLSWRMRMHGWRLRLVEDAVVRHAGGTAGLSVRTAGARYSGRRAYLHTRNRWLVLLRNARWRTLLLMAPAQALYALVYLAFAASRGQLLGALHGHLAVVPALPRVLRARRIQRRRRLADRELLVALPMTANPGLAETGPKALLRRFIDRCTAWNWALARGLGRG